MWKRVINHVGWRIRMFRDIYWPQFWLSQFLPEMVQAGPFKGMKYNRTSTGSVVLPKLIGTYENELHGIFESWDIEHYDLCVDVGAGEGYYAVGMCFRNPEIKMIAFEQSGTGRQRIRKLARRNAVLPRLQIQGRCEPPLLQKALVKGKKVLLIMDVEGYESILMNPEGVPALSHVDFIVEMHPEHLGVMADDLCRRFEKSHQLRYVRQQMAKSIPAGVRLSGYLEKNKDLLVNEFRGPQYWLAGKSIQNARH